MQGSERILLSNRDDSAAMVAAWVVLCVAGAAALPRPPQFVKTTAWGPPGARLSGVAPLGLANHGNFYARDGDEVALTSGRGSEEILDGGQPALYAVVWVILWCVGFGGVAGCFYAVCLEAVRDLLRPIAVRFSTVPLEAALAVLGVLYSVLLGSTLSAAMTRQEAQLHAVGAELASAELLEGGLNDLDTPETAPHFARALAATAAHVKRLEGSIEIFSRVNPDLVKPRSYVDPLAEVAATLAEARCPPTPLGARADLERLHMMRAARRAAEAGPRFPSGHWVVLRTLGVFCCINVALVSALSAAGSETADGALHGAILVGITSMALALSETIVADVADRSSGMYTAARSFLPPVSRLRTRLERKARDAERRLYLRGTKDDADFAPRVPQAPPPRANSGPDNNNSNNNNNNNNDGDNATQPRPAPA